ADLDSTAAALNRAQNVVARTWQRFHEDHPEWVPDQRRDRQGQPKVTKDGKPVMEHPAYPQQFTIDAYNAARAVATNVAAKVIAQAVPAVISNITARLPYN